MADAVTNVRRKMSVATVTGFKCAVCLTETVTYDNSAPPVCLDCGTPTPKITWKNIVKDTTTVEVVSF